MINVIRKWKKSGVLFQINASSVLESFGKESKKRVKYLLSNQLVDFIASDAHNCKKRGFVLQKCKKYTSKKYGKEYATLILEKMARK